MARHDQRQPRLSCHLCGLESPARGVLCHLCREYLRDQRRAG